MSVSYLGIHLGTLEYIAILLFGLIIFVIIMIATENQRQNRQRAERARENRRMSELRNRIDAEVSYKIKIKERNIIKWKMIRKYCVLELSL